MYIKFSTTGKDAIIMPKKDAEALMRKKLPDDRVDLLLLNVLAGRPMILHMNGSVVKIEAVE